MSYTKGKWEVWAELNVQSKDGRAICSCGVNNGNPTSREENIANARLIAAAPELLKNLQLLYELLIAGQPPGNDDLDAVFIAIVEATGAIN